MLQFASEMQFKYYALTDSVLSEKCEDLPVTWSKHLRTTPTLPVSHDAHVSLHCDQDNLQLLGDTSVRCLRVRDWEYTQQPVCVVKSGRISNNQTSLPIR